MKWIRNHAAKITLIGMILIVICMLCAVGLLNHRPETRTTSIKEIGALYFRHMAPYSSTQIITSNNQKFEDKLERKVI